MAVMLLCWEGNRGPGGKYWQSTAGYMTMSPSDWLLWTQRLYTSMGHLYLFGGNHKHLINGGIDGSSGRDNDDMCVATRC